MWLRLLPREKLVTSFTQKLVIIRLCFYKPSLSALSPLQLEHNNALTDHCIKLNYSQHVLHLKLTLVLSWFAINELKVLFLLGFFSLDFHDVRMVDPIVSSLVLLQLY